MRIIAGDARGRRIATLKGEDTRPTLERVKEGMFSAVQFWLPGAAVLDLYAGSGQLGLEALSRGAARCTFVDSAPAAVSLIRQNAEAIGYAAQSRVVRADAAIFLSGARAEFDLILMDPPYRAEVFPTILQKAARAMTENAILLCESEPEVPFPAAVQAEGGTLTLEKQYRYGTVMVSRYKLTGANEEQSL